MIEISGLAAASGGAGLAAVYGLVEVCKALIAARREDIRKQQPQAVDLTDFAKSIGGVEANVETLSKQGGLMATRLEKFGGSVIRIEGHLETMNGSIARQTEDIAELQAKVGKQ